LTSGKRFRYIAALVVAGLLVYAVVVASGGLRDALHQLRHASQIWLIPALVLEFSSYALAGWLLRMLRGDNDAVTWVTTVRVALVMWGLGSLLPASPAEGMAMSVAELRRRGVSRQHALTMLLVTGWFEFWALVFTAAAAAALVDAVGHPDPDDAMRLVVLAVGLMFIAVTVISIARRPITGKLAAEAIWRLPHRRTLTREQMREVGVDEHARIVRLLGGPARRAGITAAAIGWWLTDAACLGVALHAVHADVGFSVVILAYVAGTAASWVPLLPGGIGAVEIAVPAVLHHFGVPLAVGLAGTLLWRGLSLFLPALAGSAAYASLRAKRPVASA
jgi:uncharacterized protein (TIRG00374 family)